MALEEALATGLIETRTARVRLEMSGIVRLTLRQGVAQTLTDAQANLRALTTTSDHKLRPVLIDARYVKHGDWHLRHYLAHGAASRAQVYAVLSSSSLLAFVANIWFVYGYRPPPTRLFTSESDALEWLRPFLMMA